MKRHTHTHTGARIQNCKCSTQRCVANVTWRTFPSWTRMKAAGRCFFPGRCCFTSPWRRFSLHHASRRDKADALVRPHRKRLDHRVTAWATRWRIQVVQAFLGSQDKTETVAPNSSRGGCPSVSLRATEEKQRRKRRKNPRSR